MRYVSFRVTYITNTSICNTFVNPCNLQLHNDLNSIAIFVDTDFKMDSLIRNMNLGLNSEGYLNYNHISDTITNNTNISICLDLEFISTNDFNSQIYDELFKLFKSLSRSTKINNILN